jgi:cell division protein FtsL
VVQRPVPRGASFAYAVAERSLDEQLGRIEALDAKAGIVIATNGILAGLLFGRSSLLLTMPELLAALIILLVGSSLLLALIAFATRRYLVAPRPEAVRRLMSAQEDWLRWRFLGNLEETLARNDSRLTRKARWLLASLVSLMLAIVSLSAYFVPTVLSGTLKS